MARGTFANIRLVNKLNQDGKAGPKTLHIPSKEVLDVFDAADRYRHVSSLDPALAAFNKSIVQNLT